MATLITQVDRLTGNYEATFIYTVNASFNGIYGDIDSAQIKIFIPDYFNVFLGDAGEPIKSVTQVDVLNGQELIYDFGKITDLGIAVRLGFGVTFKPTASNGDTFICRPTMIINEEEFLVSTTEEITLVAVPQFEISRQIVLPSSPPAPGSAIFYKVSLENFGDLGAVVNDIVIKCSGSEFITIDTTYPVNGKDVSSKFEDKNADGIMPTFNENSLNFSIASYKGQKYEFIYRAVISENLEVGTELTSIANFSIDSVSQGDEIHELTLADKIYDATISIYAPDYSLPDEYICYKMSINNTGNQILESALFENDLPNEVVYYQFNTGSFYIGEIEQNLSAEYFINYETVNGLTGNLGPFNTDNNSIIDLSTFIAEDDNLSSLIWNLQTLGIGVKTKASPQLLGKVRDSIEMDSSIINHIHLTFNEQAQSSERVENATTLIANYCTLNPSISSSVSSNPIRPNDEINYTFSLNCRSSRVKNPILAFLMPKELLYIGEEQYIYSDIFTNRDVPTPPARIIPNFNENGDTLVKFEFIDDYEFSFRQLAALQIKFKTKVAVGALGTIKSFLLLNTKGSTGIIPNSVDIYVDNENIAQDLGVSKNYAKSSIISNTILYFVSTSSNKKVKGLLDDEYIEEPSVGKTVSGGTLEYLISVKNIGNAKLEDVEIVDILPYIGDVGVIETTTLRNSEYPIYALSEVVATILPSDEEVDFEILYSKSTDPVRFGGNFDIIGVVDDWSETAPEDLSELKSFKVRVKDIFLLPAQTLKVAITASVPVGIPVSAVAWNSFATDVSYTNLSGVKQHLLAVEPEKVGVEIVVNEPGTVKISGYSFVDNNFNGYYENSDDLVNDVAVVLYDEDFNLIRYTSTRTDLSGSNGRYSFENLPAGKYYVKFFIDDEKLKFTTQRLDMAEGSKASRKNGLSPLIDLTSKIFADDINVGIVPIGKFTLNEILTINNQSRSMVRDVIKNQMLLTMKQEDVLEIIESSLL